MAAFHILSNEGRMQKIQQHVDMNHPVPAPWVAWLLGSIGDKTVSDNCTDMENIMLNIAQNGHDLGGQSCSWEAQEVLERCNVDWKTGRSL